MNIFKILNLKSPNFWQLIGMVTSVIILSLLPFLFLREMIIQTQTFAGVKFPNGAVSFADEVVSYDPIIYLNQQNLPNVKEPFNNPQYALSIPNSSESQGSFFDLSKQNEVALGGKGGSLTLKFTDNLLTGSGNNAPDLWIFGGENKSNSVAVALSQDGYQWHNVGKINQQNRGIDIDAFGWGKEDLFSYIRLTDNSMVEEDGGIWTNDQWIGFGGANIDAVGAISGISLGGFAGNILPFPIIFPPLGFWLLVILLSSFSLPYFLNQNKNHN